MRERDGREVIRGQVINQERPEGHQAGFPQAVRTMDKDWMGVSGKAQKLRTKYMGRKSLRDPEATSRLVSTVGGWEALRWSGMFSCLHCFLQRNGEKGLK